MAKINFNTPLFDEEGQPQMRAKTDPKSKKYDSNGNFTVDLLKDEAGNLVYEGVMVKDVLYKMLRAHFAGDEKIEYGEKVKRDRLARKIATSSTANYRQEEIKMLEEFAARAGGIAFIGQFDDIVNGTESQEEPTEESKPAAKKKTAA